MTDELTVADLVAREGIPWPTVDKDSTPRHLLDEPEPQPGELTAWFNEDPPELVRPYVLRDRRTHMADSNCSKCHGTGWRDGTLSEQVAHGELGAQVPCGC